MPESSPTQLLERIQKGKPIPAIVLLGTDPYLRDLCRNGIIQAYVPDAVRDWALARVSVQGGDWSEVFQRAQTLPMLAQMQVVIIDGAETIEVKKRDDDDGPAFHGHSSPVDFSFCLVFIFGRVAWLSTGSQAQIELAIRRPVHCNKSRCGAA